MTNCKGRCIYDQRVLAHTHLAANYDAGQKACRHCSIKLITTDARCFCCNGALRYRPRRKTYDIAIPDLEPVKP